MRTWIAGATLVLPAAAAAVAAAPVEESPPRRYAEFQKAADGFIAAYRKGDAAAMDAAARTASPDPVQVVECLLAAHAKGTLATPPAAGDHFAAAEAFATRAPQGKEWDGIPLLVKAWKGLDREGLSRELRLRDAADEFCRISEPAQRRKPVPVPESVEKDLEAASVGTSAIPLLMLKFYGEHDAGRLPVAGSLIDRVVSRLRAMKWDDPTGANNGPGGAWSGPTACEALRMSALVRARMGESRRALELLREEGELRRRWSHRQGEARVLSDMSANELRLGEFASARAHAEEAARMMDAQGNVAGAALARANAASIDFMGGRYEETLKTIEKVRSAIAGNPYYADLSAQALEVIATCHLGLGRLAEAISGYEAALEERRRLPWPIGRLQTQAKLGEARIQIGDYAAGVALLEEAVRGYEESGSRWDAADFTLALSWGLRRLGKFDEAEKLVEAAEAKVRGAEWESVFRVKAAGERAAIRLERGDPAGALSVVDDHLRGIRAGEQVYLETGLRLTRLSALAALGRDVDVEAAAGEVLDLNRDFGQPTFAALALEARAAARVRRGDLRGAAADARESIESRLGSLPGLSDEEGLGNLRFFRSAVDAGFEAWRRLASEGDRSGVEQAAWFAEAGRALALVGSLRSRRALVAGAVPAALLDEEAAARQAHDEASRRLAGVGGAPAPAGKDLEAARAAKVAAWTRLREANTRVERAGRLSAGDAFPRPRSLEEIRAILAPGEALVVLHLAVPGPADGGRASAVVVRGDGARIVDLGETKSIEERIEGYLAVVQEGSADDGPAAEALYDRLLRPLEPALEGARRVVVSPEGAALFLPWEALRRKGHEGKPATRALERWEFAYVPSGTVLAELRAGARPRGEWFVGLGDPVYPGESKDARARDAAADDTTLRGLENLARLPLTADEVAAAAAHFPEGRRALLLRGDASRAGLARALAGTETAGIAALHVACHGHVDAAKPWFTGLVLSGGEVLGAQDLQRMAIPAEVAVLSACETARGRVAVGEGVVGLARGLFRAGCPRVVVSDWKVADRATKDLMAEFYRRWRKDGLPVGTALREARLSMLRSGGPDAHPARWAPFVLWGLPD